MTQSFQAKISSSVEGSEVLCLGGFQTHSALSLLKYYLPMNTHTQVLLCVFIGEYYFSEILGPRKIGMRINKTFGPIMK